MALLVVVGVPLAVLWAFALVDIVKRDDLEFPPLQSGLDQRIFWILVVLLLSGIGATFYYFMVMRPYPRRRR
jgi:hypothetical protein